MKKQTWLNLGCGIRLLSNFINVDVAFDLKDLKEKKGTFVNAEIDKNSAFVKADMRKLPFKDNSADGGQQCFLCVYWVGCYHIRSSICIL